MGLPHFWLENPGIGEEDFRFLEGVAGFGGFLGEY